MTSGYEILKVYLYLFILFVNQGIVEMHFRRSDARLDGRRVGQNNKRRVRYELNNDQFSQPWNS